MQRYSNICRFIAKVTGMQNMDIKQVYFLGSIWLQAFDVFIVMCTPLHGTEPFLLSPFLQLDMT